MAKTPGIKVEHTAAVAGLDPAQNPAANAEDADAAAQDAAVAEAGVQSRIDEAVAAAVAAALAGAAADVAEDARADAIAAEARGVAPLVTTKRITIILEENDDIPPTGLFIGVNGRSYLLRPGEEVPVPEEVVHALNDAVTAVPKTDQQGNVIDYKNRLRFPYRIVSDSL
jgi:hypothetical protein